MGQRTVYWILGSYREHEWIFKEFTMPIKDGKSNQTRIVARLAAQCQVSIGEMAALYETERAKLATGAHITKFLDVFATRHVLEAFQQKALATPVQTPPEQARTGE